MVFLQGEIELWTTWAVEMKFFFFLKKTDCNKQKSLGPGTTYIHISQIKKGNLLDIIRIFQQI